jgi:hypothetical protein
VAGIISKSMVWKKRYGIIGIEVRIDDPDKIVAVKFAKNSGKIMEKIIANSLI